MKNIFDLSGKVVIITGATGLLGRQHADAVASFGGNPILLDLDKDIAETFAEELNDKYGVKASGWSVNITDEEQISLNCQNVLDQYGKIDALINNAANNPKVEASEKVDFSRMENFPTNVWDQDIAVGLTGSFLCAKHYGMTIANNPNGGVILNISSDLGLIAPDQRLYRKDGLPDDQQPVKPVTYSVVKSGLIGLTRYLATYWADKNVRCNALCPGGVEAGQDENFLKEVTARIPLGRMANADEYQGAIVFMLSDAASYMNGAIVPIEGGRSTW